MRYLYLALEWSCHGVLWLLITFAWLSNLWMTSAEFTLPKRFIESTVAWSFSHWLSNVDDSQFPNDWTKVYCLLFSLLLDISVVGSIKCFFRRPRPDCDNAADMRLTVPQDVWSFPSGHATRAVMLFWLLPTMSVFFHQHWTYLGLWATVVCCSRYLMGRHHLSDVLAGAMIGFIEYQFVITIPWPNLLYVVWFGR